MDYYCMNNSIIQALESNIARRVSALPNKLRLFTQEIESLPRALILTGSRGVGKSTFLLHHAKDRNLLYFSADNPLVMPFSLSEIAKAIFMAGY